jgi:ATP-dependent protease HslVU (ClpYQ) peptidase subunit
LKELKVNDKVMAAEIGGATDALTLKENFSKPIGFKPGSLGGLGSIVLFD